MHGNGGTSAVEGHLFLLGKTYFRSSQNSFTDSYLRSIIHAMSFWYLNARHVLFTCRAIGYPVLKHGESDEGKSL